MKNLQKLEALQTENNFHIENGNFYKEGVAELISWRNTLLSFPNLKFYVGGPPIGEFGQDDIDWISRYLPKVGYRYRDIGY